MITLSITKLVLCMLSTAFLGMSLGVLINLLIQHIFSCKELKNDTKNTQDKTDKDTQNANK